MDIKKILESIDRVEEGMPMAPPTMPAPQDEGRPVTMNVNLSATGKEHVDDLMSMMKNAGMGGPEPKAMPMPAPRLDIERLKNIVDGPKDMDELKPGMQKEKCPKCGKVHLGNSSCNDSIENDDEAVAEYDNEPDEQYSDHNTMVNDLSGGLNRKKKMYAKAQDGDNPMSVKEEIYKGLKDLYAQMTTEAKDEKPLPSAKEIKKMHDDGKTKKQIMAAYSGCDKEKMEKLYAGSCGGH